MQTKLAILRGINVGGKRKILMTDLKDLFLRLKFEKVSTYIQSGNVIFTSNHTCDDEIANKIEAAIYKQYGFEVPVIIRSKQQLVNLINRNPFYSSSTSTSLDKSLHLTFLKTPPTPTTLATLATLADTEAFTKVSESDRFVIDQQEVFILCQGKYHQSKLTNNFFEKKLNTSATTRNWKTVLNLAEIITVQ